MDVVSLDEGHYDHMCSDDTSSSDDETNESSEQLSDDPDGTNDDLREDLQKALECYKSDSNLPNNASTSETNNEDFQASALCQFMDILNDLDDVLDKSLLACLDDSSITLNSDKDDVICKLTDGGTLLPISSVSYPNDIEHVSLDDNAQVITPFNAAPSAPLLEDIDIEEIPETHSIRMVHSKSLSDLSPTGIQTLTPLQGTSTNDNIRVSMRRLDPVAMPAIDQEPLTLPVILFLEHHVNLRPTSAPMQIQVANSNSEASGPLILGRRALLMNRALSLPSPVDSDVTGEWTGRNTARSVTGSLSTSSSSSESLNGVLPPIQTNSASQDERMEETEEPPFGVWPHQLSCMLACLSCTVGVFNISRFAMFSVHFGACFIVQFFILSLLMGIPLFTLHLCLGQVLESGPLDMWSISPIFRGVGIALLLTQAVIGVYSIMGVSWIFVYFRDSFITSDDKYKWALPHDWNFDEPNSLNATYKIQDTIPQYFHGEVLQRNLGSNSSHYGTIKFQVAFNLAVVWMIVFVALSKGLRSYGKAVYILIFLPICGTLVLCAKLLTLIPYDTVTNIFSETEWSEFFLNSNRVPMKEKDADSYVTPRRGWILHWVGLSWAAATQETFLTWGLLGACIMQLTSHKTAKNNTSASLQRESACIVVFTFAVLLLASFLANTCMQILKNAGYAYIPGSFETAKTSQFLFPSSEPLPSTTPLRYTGHYGSLVGLSVWRTGSASQHLSGWQPLELATQIVPATLAVLPANLLSPAWAVIFYFILITFGLAQQLAVWHCVTAGLVAIEPGALRLWESTITFLSCVAGLLAGLCLTTEAGIRIVHFVDYVWVGAWWHCLLHVALVCGVFVVRGRPYSGEAVVAALYGGSAQALAALLSFTWNVILPVVLCAVCVIDFRTGQQRVLYNWRKATGYWPPWCRQVAVVMQQSSLLVVPVAAFVQTWRYMSKGPPDVLDRIQNLYRPRIPPAGSPPAPPAPPPAPEPPAPDPPPKYTPPPSYSTATGARLLDTLRRSFRTLRRITTSRPESTISTDTSHIPITLSEAVDGDRTRTDTHPPTYSGVFTDLTITDETAPTHAASRNSLAFTRDYLRRSFVKSDSVKNIRSSLRRSFKYGGALTTSHEHLVRDAEPISSTVAMSAMLDADGSPHARSRASVI